MVDFKRGRRSRLCVVLTSPLALNAFLLDQVKAWCDHFDVTVCVNTAETPVSARLDSRAELVHVDIARAVHPLKDLLVLIRLTAMMLRRRFDAVHSLTPKGGLLGMLAGWLARVPCRTHVFTGQVWATRSGFSRFYLKWIDRLIASCAIDVLADSQSQARFLEGEGVSSPQRIQVLGAGSLSGVDLLRFSPLDGRRSAVRAELGISEDDTVFLFLGRFRSEKGLHVLLEAFCGLIESGYQAHLLCVGPDEGGLTDAVLQATPGRTHVIGLTPCPERYVDAADVLVLPSFREGFGSVVIEAAAMGRPAVASRIYGLVDAVADGETGILVAPGDADSLRCALVRMLEPQLRQAMGAHAQARARAFFSSEEMTQRWVDFYRVRLSGKLISSTS